MFYISRWSSAEKAAEFAGIYARSLKKRYQKLEEIRQGSSEAASVEAQERKVELLQGRHLWNTEEGTIVIEQNQEMVFVSESLDPATTDTLAKEVFGGPN